MNNPIAPHQAIITLHIDIMERLEDGRVTGIPVKRINKLYTVVGKNLQECEEKVNNFITKRINENESEKTN